MLSLPSTATQRLRYSIHRVLVLLLLAAALGGCNGGNVTDTTTAPQSTGATATGTAASGGGTSAATLDVTISGSVGDGPVTGATVSVYDASGALLGTVVSDRAASYSKDLQVQASQYPLRLVAKGGIDLVTGQAPDFNLVSVVRRTSDRIANINPFSTLIVYIADRMPGGMTATNMSTARSVVVERLGFGLDSSTLLNPITSSVTAGNVANLVKASEALGELVRRTRDLIRATGRTIGGNSVMTALAADLVDGFVDGLGASGTDATVSAVANVVSAQVLVEAMSNNLRVGGVIATGVIDQSIKSTHAGIGDTQLSGSVRINGTMIQQAQTALAAAQVLDSSATVASIEQKVGALTGNSTASAVASVLPANTTNSLATASGRVAGTSNANLTQINQVVFAQGDTGATTAASGGATSGGGSNATASGSTTGSGSTSGTGGTTATGGAGGTATASGSGTGSSSSGTSSGSTATAGSASSGGTAATTGSFTVNWVAPVARSDGTPLALSAIAGYRIYYGNRRGDYPNSSTIADGAARSAKVANLASGTYYLVMTTYDTGGLESAYSGEVVKNVP